CANQSPALFPREQLPPLSAIYLIHAGAAGSSDIIRSADAIVSPRRGLLGSNTEGKRPYLNELPRVSSPTDFCRALLRMRDRRRLRLGPPTKSHVSKERPTIVPTRRGRPARIRTTSCGSFPSRSCGGTFGKLHATLAGRVHQQREQRLGHIGWRVAVPLGMDQKRRHGDLGRIVVGLPCTEIFESVLGNAVGGAEHWRRPPDRMQRSRRPRRRTIQPELSSPSCLPAHRSSTDP